jgi:hypothetical protein
MTPAHVTHAAEALKKAAKALHSYPAIVSGETAAVTLYNTLYGIATLIQVRSTEGPETPRSIGWRYGRMALMLEAAARQFKRLQANSLSDHPVPDLELVSETKEVAFAWLRGSIKDVAGSDVDVAELDEERLLARLDRELAANPDVLDARPVMAEGVELIINDYTIEVTANQAHSFGEKLKAAARQARKLAEQERTGHNGGQTT